MTCFLNEIVILNSTVQPVTQLVEEGEALLAFLTDDLGVETAAPLSILGDGENIYAAEYAELKAYTDSAAIYDPNVAPRPFSPPMVSIHYTGQRLYCDREKYIFGSAGLFVANLRFQHRRAVWHETLHALGIQGNCPDDCVMSWEVPTTRRLCPVCRMKLEAALQNRAEYARQLREDGLCEYASMVRRQREEGEEHLAGVLGLG